METKQHGELCAQVAETGLEFWSSLVLKVRPRISEGHLLLVNLKRERENKWLKWSIIEIHQDL